MNTRHPLRRQQGFTLIEVLVAISLMALVSVIAWRGLQHVADAHSRIQSQSADTDQVIRALGQLARDLELAYTGPAFEAGGTPVVVPCPADNGFKLR
ncbi:prepilin-type cleavage/methylation N-terminal domain protein, partial [Bordetella hinzii CA90 BAL1384]|uniref:PulJ/GspJ family protein n=1 Tax=Bordetella hinzii TaxID=103855 RepID=UPI00045B238E